MLQALKQSLIVISLFTLNYTENKCLELNGNQCRYLSRCIMQPSHNPIQAIYYLSRYRYRSRAV